jgi:hypothetical protein
VIGSLKEGSVFVRHGLFSMLTRAAPPASGANGNPGEASGTRRCAGGAGGAGGVRHARDS